MTFDLHLSIPENSPAGRAVQRVVAEEHITPEQAVTRILTEAANQHKTSAHRMIGLFSSDKDAVLIDEVMELVTESRETQTTRNIGL